MVSNPKRPVGHVPVVVRVFSQQERKAQHTSPVAHSKSHGQGQIQEVEKQIPPLGGAAKSHCKGANKQGRIYNYVAATYYHYYHFIKKKEHLTQKS